MDDKAKNKIANIVSVEIATICKFYGIDFYGLDDKERNAYIEVFQAGVKFLSKNEALQSFLTNENKKDE